MGPTTTTATTRRTTTSKTTTNGVVVAALVGALAGAGCDDIDSPAELDHPQLLAVAATPSCIAPGERAELSVLVAGAQGTIAPRSVRWALLAGPGVVTEDAGYEVEQASAALDGEARVLAEVELADSTVLLGEKSIRVAGPGQCPGDPRISGIESDGEPIAGALRLTGAEAITVTIRTDPAPADWQRALVTWHTTCGEIADYRRPSASLSPGKDACIGTLYAVYRDGEGGIAWREQALEVVP